MEENSVALLYGDGKLLETLAGTLGGMVSSSGVASSIIDAKMCWRCWTIHMREKCDHGSCMQGISSAC
jgi:hypothetical protein